jgi:hypothetical protein
VGCVSPNTRWRVQSVSRNVRRKTPMIARPADHHCRSLHLLALALVLGGIAVVEGAERRRRVPGTS